MALPSLLTDPNFIYLQHLLQLNPREAYGLLDYGWLLLNITGDPNYQSAEHLAAVLHWHSSPKRLAQALVKTGFIKPKRGGGYTVAQWETRMQEWGKKRMQRAQEKEQHAADERRRTAPSRRPTDPDPVSSSKRANIIPLDHDSPQGKDRNRPKKAGQTTPEASKNPQGAAQDALRAVLGGLKGVGVRQTRQSAPPPEQPIGSYTARDCALAAASLDRGNDHDSAVAMWTSRAAELSQYTGGLDYFRDLLCQVHNAANPQLRKGVGPIHNPAAFLNVRTAAWLQDRRNICNA